jgi:hypothetical protein
MERVKIKRRSPELTLDWLCLGRRCSSKAKSHI